MVRMAPIPNISLPVIAYTLQISSMQIFRHLIIGAFILYLVVPEIEGGWFKRLVKKVGRGIKKGVKKIGKAARRVVKGIKKVGCRVSIFVHSHNGNKTTLYS